MRRCRAEGSRRLSPRLLVPSSPSQDVNGAIRLVGTTDHCQQASHRHHCSFGGNDSANHAGHACRDLSVELVGLDLCQRLSRFDAVPRRFEPTEQLGLRHRHAELGHLDCRRHAFPLYASSARTAALTWRGVGMEISSRVRLNGVGTLGLASRSGGASR